MKTEHTTVERSSALPVCRKKSGSRCQLSVQGAAHPSTQTVRVSFGGSKLELDAEAMQVLVCLLEGYMAETWSGDRTALAFYAAKARAEKVGVSEERFAEIANIIFEANDKRRKKNPFVASGFMA